MRPKLTVDLMKAKNSPKGGMFPFFNPKAPDWCPMSMLGETKVLNQMKNLISAWILAVFSIAVTSGCHKGTGLKDPSPWWKTPYMAEFSGTVPVEWPFCKPFVDDNAEDVRGFLIVEKVKDHPTIKDSGVKPGDICLSWATQWPEVPETLRDAWLGFLNWGRGDEDVCWFARDVNGIVEVFSCDAVCLYECMASPRTFGLALAPKAFGREAVDRIEKAVAVRSGNAFDEARISHEEDEWSEAAANRNLAGLTSAMLARDSGAAKQFFKFPVRRPGRLPDVEEANFDAAFEEIFDDAFFAEFENAAKSKGRNLWEQLGWRGFFAPGLSSDDGKSVTGIDYVSAAERKHLEALQKSEILALPPALRNGVVRPLFSFKTDDGSWRGRLDVMEEDAIRIALWTQERPLSEPPDISCGVAFVPDGNGGNGCYLPIPGQNHGVFSGLVENCIGSDETPPLELLLSQVPAQTNAIMAESELWLNWLDGKME